jgi:hypothetical protein
LTATVTKTFTKTSTATAIATSTPTFTPTAQDGFFISKNVFIPSQGDLLIHVSISDAPGKYGMYIFNSAGEHIRTIEEFPLDGTYTTTKSWDGKNKYGAPCASGIYIVYVTEPMKTLRGRVVLIR